MVLGSFRTLSLCGDKVSHVAVKGEVWDARLMWFLL
jgi:hypothetical protein